MFQRNDDAKSEHSDVKHAEPSNGTQSYIVLAKLDLKNAKLKVTGQEKYESLVKKVMTKFKIKSEDAGDLLITYIEDLQMVQLSDQDDLDMLLEQIE